MRTTLVFSTGIALCAAASLFLAACGEEGHEESFDTYGECYEHGRAEGLTSTGAFAECDEMFSPTYTDNPMCVEFYNDFSQIPMDAITAYCDGMSF